MEMGKITARLRDAVPVCLLVEGKEIKRYKNIEIPVELKKLEYKDFNFDVPLSGAITFKFMFEPGVLPEVFPQERERKTRKPLIKEAQLQQGVHAADVAAAKAHDEIIKTEIFGYEATGQVLVITAQPESTEAMAQPESVVSAKKQVHMSKSKRGASATEDTDK